jgi:leucyl aminopeptidase
MGGAAAAMGTIEVVARLKLNVHLRVIIPTTDNSVDAQSIKPGDVISSYSGKTIEVIDTDAEGRLILADGLSYAVKNDNPDYLIDLATLTGSIVRSIGTEAAGIMSHNDELVSQLTTMGSKTGEKLWRMPLWEEYGKHMKSDVADIKNLSAKPMAGSITAAKFLEAFVEKHPAWAHMDIAGTAFGAFPTSKAYSGTGYGIDLLTQWLRSIS